MAWVSVTPTGCSRGAGGSDGGGGALVGDGGSVAVSGVCASMTEIKKRMISPMTAPRREK